MSINEKEGLCAYCFRFIKTNETIFAKYDRIICQNCFQTEDIKDRDEYQQDIMSKELMKAIISDIFEKQKNKSKFIGIIIDKIKKP